MVMFGGYELFGFVNTNAFGGKYGWCLTTL